jgi:hypothetical protein
MASKPAALSAPPKVYVRMSVANRFTDEVRHNPRIEVGGKYVGFIQGPTRLGSVHERHAALPAITFEIVDFIDAGPQAKRTATYHLGDRDYQLARFRALEKQYPDLENLGSWHSHHPNGLAELSGDDVKGYFSTVNDRHHNHDFFVVSLGVDNRGFDGARHFLFVRGDEHYYQIPCMTIRDRSQPEPGTPGPSAGTTSAVPGGQSTPPPAPSTPTMPSAPTPSAPTPSAPTMLPPAPARTHAEASHQPSTKSLQDPPSGVPTTGWDHPAEARERLAEDQRLVKRHFPSLRYSIKAGRLLLTGPVAAGEVHLTVEMVYPSAIGKPDGLIKIKSRRPVAELLLTAGAAADADHLHAAVRTIESLLTPPRSLSSRIRRGFGLSSTPDTT